MVPRQDPGICGPGGYGNGVPTPGYQHLSAFTSHGRVGRRWRRTPSFGALNAPHSVDRCVDAPEIVTTIATFVLFAGTPPFSASLELGLPGDLFFFRICGEMHQVRLLLVFSLDFLLASLSVTRLDFFVCCQVIMELDRR